MSRAVGCAGTVPTLHASNSFALGLPYHIHVYKHWLSSPWQLPKF